jgi:hypothetical protein
MAPFITPNQVIARHPPQSYDITKKQEFKEYNPPKTLILSQKYRIFVAKQ